MPFWGYIEVLEKYRVFNPKKIIEAALFISSKPLTTETLSELTGLKGKEVRKIVSELVEEYKDKPFSIFPLNKGYLMKLKDEYIPFVRELIPEISLSKVEMKTLAVIFFNEPIKQAELVKIRGNSAYKHIKKLVKKELVNVTRRKGVKIVKTTEKFKRLFLIRK